MANNDWLLHADEIAGKAPQVSKSMYQRLFDNNPYRSPDLTYNKSEWQDLLSALGFRTKADAWAESVQENALQWDAGIYQQMYADQFNSESAKAQRMRDAGENPDLLGTGNVSEASAPFQDPEGINLGEGEEGVISQIASTVASAFNSAVGIATQFANLQNMSQDIEGKGISNARSMMDIISQRVLGMTPSEGFKSDDDFKQWKKDVTYSLREPYGRAFFRGSSLRRWNRSIDDFIGGLPQTKEQYAEWRQRLGDAKEYLLGREDHWSEATEVFKIVNEELIDLRKAITENKAVKESTELDRDIEKATNELQYEQELQPGMKASAENARNKRVTEGEDFEGILNTHLNKLGKRLDNLSKQGGIKGLIGEVILLLMTMKFNMKVDKSGNLSYGFTPPTPQG